VDFECTCDDKYGITLAEIIEFPMVVIDVKLAKIVNIFRSYVRPTIHPFISKFCTEMTGVT